MKKPYTAKHENGVALLFALGLLSLMSILGIAFVTNTLTLKKTAVNIGARNQAQLLMDSAVDRILASVMVVLRQDAATTRYDAIYSTDNGSPRSASSALNSKDQLTDQQTSLLNVFIPGQPRYDGSKSEATWQYLRDNTGKITGRMAYQVLPTGTSGISLDQVLRGIYTPDRPGMTGVGNPTPASSAAWSQRIGKDIREFNIGKAAAFANEWKYADTGIYQAIPASDMDIVANYESFFSTDIFANIIAGSDANVNEQRKAWLRHWFSESQRAVPEVFYRAGNNKTKLENATPYHRFNLSTLAGTPTDAWYSRFKGFDGDSGGDNSMKNDTKVINELLKDSQIFYPEDAAAPPGVGLPFLRMIGGTKAGFADLETRRRQIAANLNDYCDSDSIPTSDIASKDWSDTNIPAYTGNEKTPYINEVSAGVGLTPSIDSNYKVTFKPVPQFVAELIDIYGGANKNYTLKSWCKNFKFTIKLSASGTVEYTKNGEAESKNFSHANFDAAAASLTFQADADIFTAPGTPAADFAGGYNTVVLTSASPLPEQSVNLKTLLLDFIRGTDAPGGYAITKVDFTEFRITVSEFSIDFTASALFDASGNGVDFVKGPGRIAPVTGIPFYINTESLSPASGTAHPFWHYIYLTGLEVRDPRQNLNFNSANTANQPFTNTASDWRAVPELQSVAELPVGGGSIGTMTLTATGTFTGGKNSASNPSAPFTTGGEGHDLFAAGTAGESGVDYDRETVSDPAWIAADADKHLSTAFIRNAPMQSLWELGVIHRGSAWQTLNIKGVVKSSGGTVRRLELSDLNFAADLNAAGFSYTDGDAAILDQVKLTPDAYSSGKVDVNMLVKMLETPTPAPNYDVSWNKNIARALFCNILLGHQIGDLYQNPVPYDSGRAVSWNAVSDDVINRLIAVSQGHSDPHSGRYISRADFIEGPEDPTTGSTYCLANGFGIVPNWISLTDAGQEEMIGKTANLLTAGATAPTTIQAIVVVQTIKSAPDGQVIVRPTYNTNGTPVNPAPSMTSTADFDIEPSSHAYIDEITSELRALVTIKVIDSDGIRCRLHNIKYL